MKTTTLALLSGALLISGCTAVTVQPLASAPANMCIEKNPKVQVNDFVSVMQSSFKQYGFNTRVVEKSTPVECPYLVTYSARRSWDLATYLSQAEVHVLNEQRREVASAHYHLRGKGGLSLMKWQGTQSKIRPVMDQLLRNSQVLVMANPSENSVQPTTSGLSKEQQIDALRLEKLSYEEYQERYKAIMQQP